MIKKFGDYEQTQGYSASEQLPRGGYVCKIIGAKPIENSYGQSIKVAFDIAEGEYKDYYQKKYDNNTSENKKWPGTFLLNVPADDGSERDGWTKRRFRTFTDALEDSNKGYHFDWDETKFKGKMIGFAFNYREWVNDEGKSMFSPNAASAYPVDKIRKGNFKIPADRLLSADKRPAQTPQNQNSDEWKSIIVPEGTDEEIPF